jgi:soluble lytic murein transglycosylase-like protein
MEPVKFKYIHIAIFCILTVLFTHLSPINADIYMYIDNNGVIHFTNVLTASSTDYRIYIKEKPSEVLELGSSDKYDRYIEEASRRHGVSFPLVKAIIKAESDFNPLAISKKGALGLMQIMPENLDVLNIRDPFNPWENILGGTRYFKMMLNRFNDKLPLSLAAYNAGPTAVAHYKSIPPFKETEDYVEKVMMYYYSYKY